MSASDPFKPAGTDGRPGDEAATQVAPSPGPQSSRGTDAATAVGSDDAPAPPPATGQPSGGEEPGLGHLPAEKELVEPHAPDPDERGADQDPDAIDEPGLDLKALAARAAKADEYLGLAQRTKADFENFRKRAARDAAAAQERGIAKLARELLPAVDNLDRALQAAEAAGNGDGAETLASGVKLVHADVIAALARVGIEPYSPKGEVFDPQLHEAIAQQPVEGAEPGTVAEVYQCGYRHGESVLRPARVVVAG
jgi:molecular chaperone GrpE